MAAARRAVGEAESDFNQPVLTPEQIAKVEASHTSVLEAQDRSEGRSAAAGPASAWRSSRADERQVLERLGFSTYADYVVKARRPVDQTGATGHPGAAKTNWPTPKMTTAARTASRPPPFELPPAA